MHIEIERKFLVKAEFRHLATHCKPMVQAYVSNNPTVRVRLSGNEAWLTIKGHSADEGLSRSEWEISIEPERARDLLSLCLPGAIEKTRYYVPIGKHVYEVDVFEGDNAGLIVAEIELTATDEDFEQPEWLGEEVTGDRRYYNSSLTRHPYKTW